MLATKDDILVSSELAEFLGKQQLDGDRMYRIDRHDAMNEVPIEQPIEDQLEYCRTHLIRVNTREGTFNVSHDGRPTLSANDVASPESGLLFGGGWFAMESHVKGENFRWAADSAEVLLPPAREGDSALMIHLEPGFMTGGLPLELVVEAEGEPLARLEIEPAQLDFACRWPHRCRRRSRSPLEDRKARWPNWICASQCFRVFRIDWEQRLPKRNRGRFLAGLRASYRARQQVDCGLERAPARDQQAGARRSAGAADGAGVPVAAAHAEGVPGVGRRGGSGGERHPAAYAEALPPEVDAARHGDFSRRARTGGGQWVAEAERLSRRRLPRDASNGAEIIAAPIDSENAVLALQVEPVKTMSVKSFEVAVLDEEGRTIGKQTVKGLSYLKFPVKRTAGRSDVLRLSFPDTSAEGFGLRVFWCGWVTDGKGVKAAEALSLPWGAGWKRDPVRGTMASAGTAELILRASPRPLFLDVEADNPVRMEIHDAGGRLLAAFPAGPRAVHPLEVTIEGGGLRALRVTGTGPFRAYGVDWEGAQEAAAAVQDQPSPGFLHTNGCGDFTLLSRERWFDLRGYPEIDVFSMNLDSMFCFAAHYGGAREAILADPMRIYHIEHGTGSGWTPEGQVKLFERIGAKGIPCVENDEVLAWAKQMRRLKSPLIFNHEDWGMRDLELKESTLSGRWREKGRG